MNERKHALLSASSSHRWLKCTPSARLEETLPEEESTYAQEGTLAHEIAELKLRKHFVEPAMKGYKGKLNKLQGSPLYQEEMLRHTDTYLDHISQIIHSYTSPPHVTLEKMINYSEWVPEGFGTGDCIIIGGKTLYVIDFKYGKGVPVSAVDNSQMKLYALGAIREYSVFYQIEDIALCIIQPRLDNISKWCITSSELFNWGESIKSMADNAYKGLGDYIPGEHCQFCRAKAVCRGRTEFYLSLDERKQALPPLISNDEIGAILKTAQCLAKWVKELEDYALNECLNGKGIQGWKAVEGKSNRQFSSVDEAFKVLKSNGYDETMLYERKPLTLTAVETLLGKPAFKTLLNDHVIKSQGKPTLAPENDKREAIKRTSANDDFKDEIPF